MLDLFAEPSGSADLNILFDAIGQISSLPDEERFCTFIEEVAEIAPLDYSVLLRIEREEGSAKILHCPNHPELVGDVMSFTECPKLLDFASSSKGTSIWRRVPSDSRLLAWIGMNISSDEPNTVTIYPLTSETSFNVLLLISNDKAFPENYLPTLEHIRKISWLYIGGTPKASRTPSTTDSLISGGSDVQMIGACDEMLLVFSTIRKFASVDAPVLILGESGTGKELVAKSIHERSSRRTGPLIAINCGAIPEALLESELFGHEKGSFTGAFAQKRGLVEMANRGTLFLDEVGELAPALQVKLLRFLETYRFDRVGGNRTIEVNVRVIAATNKDLMLAVKTGKFREDLYYRLAVLSLSLPPLRKRGEDVTIMSRFFLSKYTEEYNRNIEGFTQDALEAIKAYEWPGNIRELTNRIRKAVVLAEGEFISPADFGFVNTNLGDGPRLSLALAKDRLEGGLIKEVLAYCKGNICRAARELCVSRPHLYGLMRKQKIALSSLSQLRDSSSARLTSLTLSSLKSEDSPDQDK